MPIKQIIQIRRCLFLHHILQQSENSLVFKFFASQLEDSKQGDWASQVLKDLEDFKIDLEIEEIRNMSIHQFKSIVKDNAVNFAFENLIIRKEGRQSEHSKGRNIRYTHLKMADYFTSINTDLTIEDKKWMFLCRMEDIEVKANKRWKYEDILCKSCELQTEETQQHVLFCTTLLGANEIMTYIPNYQELFEDDLEGQNYVSRLLSDNYNRRIV